MTPKEYYQQALTTGRIRPDARQLPVIDVLNTLFQTIETQSTPQRFLNRFRKKTPVKGLYLWGSVGIGKTFLMDCFYHCLTIPKLRLHFHQFMRRLHEELKTYQGKKNPLTIIAKKLATETRVICFDEFFVSDIADAMILGEFFSHLFENGIILVTSSNIPPELLYKEGLQRERFLPTIALIKQNTTVIHLHSTMDYRQQHIRQAGVFYTPLNMAAEKNIENAFTHFSNGAAPSCAPIIICDRPIAIIKQAGSVVWFDFETICGRPRSQMDYLAITQQFHTVIVEKLRAIQPNENDLIVSFIYLVDILYDAHCRLIISSDINMTEIYTNEKKDQPFQRTLSRLIEMQSEAYVYPETEQSTLTSL
ncbi:MAG: cell division protein ZapE [Coxiellaceae bacterium]|nr:cell division protein ZapE [Coxiellaceae bacterium]